MSIIELDVNSFKQNFNIDKEIRYKYGEINTPFFLINKILDLIDPYEFENPDKKWLDIGTGSGYFSIILYKRLFKGLEKKIKNTQERNEHIIKNMIYMTEIRKENCDLLQELFGFECNLFKGDFLSADISELFNNIKFDFVIGNPPYNNNGLKKVPSNNISSKKEDGTTVWIPFIKKSVDLLKTKSGQLVVIIPSLWLKPDKAKMYHFMINYKLEYLNCMTNTETNQIFNKYAQTPTCYFKLTKTKNPGFITVFDKDINEYIMWSLRENKPIPLFGYNVIKKINSKLTDENKLLISKTNLPSKHSIFSTKKTDIFTYPCINTCVLNKLKPELVIEYCNRKEKYYGIPKLVMAHKMYGFPYLDLDGKYGISNRDNYVIINKSLQELERLKMFFSTKSILYVFESTRYRMKYLEKYIFELIPDITKLKDFPEIITDDTIAKYFHFTENDVKNINKLHKKQYEWF
jgi:tRNA1(Val) A37 N6-methylase TrmN6